MSPCGSEQIITVLSEWITFLSSRLFTPIYLCVRTWDDALIRSFGFWLFNANVIDNYTSVQGMVTIVTTSKSCASCIVLLTSMGLAWLGTWFCVCIYGDLLLRCCDILIKYFKWYIFRIIFILLNSMSWDST